MLVPTILLLSSPPRSSRSPSPSPTTATLRFRYSNPFARVSHARVETATATAPQKMPVAPRRFAPSTIWLPPPPARFSTVRAAPATSMFRACVPFESVPGFPAGVSAYRYIYCFSVDSHVITGRNHLIGRCASHLLQFRPLSTIWHPQNLMTKPQRNRVWHTNIRACAPQNRRTAPLLHQLCIKILFTTGRTSLA